MSEFSQLSESRLAGVHPTLVKLLSEITQHFDCTVIQGVRTKEQQSEDVAKHLSETMRSAHLVQDDGWGHAVDVGVNPQHWDDSPRETRLTTWNVQQIAFLFYCKGFAKARGVDLRIGCDWDNDNQWDGMFKSQPFLDLDHIELP